MATPKAQPHGRSMVQTIRVKTSRRTELKDITGEVEAAVRDSGCSEGVCHLYVPHTTAGVIVNEGDDPAVARDIEAALDRLIPHTANYTHSEGNSDSHIKTAIVGSSQTVLVEDGRLALGRWQSVFLAEFDGPRTREVRIKIVPDPAA
ncbi:MAG TPA: secondary thiamine-phosphate synthase enzyme YjbQ [Candidatus Baltobacteraceae bacterium]|jgi:secondary thiamine-phosphate synthase enzyme|nr:secondary thiamine-phosphate synthase enzyme YjbQ [Candidatus Baltobacteraceae bacterium]